MRWWTYQKERFPVLTHGVLILAFSGCALLYSSALTAGPLPGVTMYLVAFTTCFIFFLQLRIADEFKDAEEDATYRPYRPVPRGLIRLRELAVVFVIGASIQLALALLFSPPLLIILIFAWAYLALMSVEFFAREWLKARPITYLWTHMLIMPIVDLYATACFWQPTLGSPPSGLIWFLAASFTNGLVIELGRKIRAPEDEEEGVPTYSKLWGVSNATLAWLGCLTTTALLAGLAAWQVDQLPPVLALLTLLVISFAIIKKPGKRIENLSALWTLALYLSLAFFPVVMP